MSVSSWLTMRRSTSPCVLSRLGAMLSISSIKMIAGAFFSASWNTLRRLLSLSPASLLMISGPLTMTKNAPVSLATARAMSVLPLPGGPYSRMPFLLFLGVWVCVCVCVCWVCVCVCREESGGKPPRPAPRTRAQPPARHTHPHTTTSTPPKRAHLWRLDADRLEQHRVAQRQLDELADLRHLLAHAADVVVADLVELLLVLALDRLALAKDLGVGRDDAVLGRVGLDDLLCGGWGFRGFECVCWGEKRLFAQCAKTGIGGTPTQSGCAKIGGRGWVSFIKGQRVVQDERAHDFDEFMLNAPLPSTKKTPARLPPILPRWRLGARVWRVRAGVAVLTAADLRRQASTQPRPPIHATRRATPTPTRHDAPQPNAP